MQHVVIPDEDLERAAWDMVRQGEAPSERSLLLWIRDETYRRVQPARPDHERNHAYTRVDASDAHVAATHRVLWKLILNRVLMPGDFANGSCLAWNGTALSGNFTGLDPLPADPRFLLGLKEDGLDEIGQHYAREAVRCFNAGAHTGAMAMLGVASEHVIETLMEAYASSARSSAAFAGKLAKERFIKPRFDLFRADFEPNSKTILRDAGVQDSSFQFITGVFDTIRLDRNEAGHPSGRPFDPETVQGHLLLFRANLRRCAVLTRYLAANPRS